MEDHTHTDDEPAMRCETDDDDAAGEPRVDESDQQAVDERALEEAGYGYGV